MVSVTERFEQLSAGFGAERWPLLGALASERKVLPSAILRLPEAQRVNDAWLEHYREVGLIADAGLVHAALTIGSPRGERALAIAPEFRALTLRRVAKNGALAEVRATGRALLGDRSLSSFVTAFYTGELGAVERALPGLKFRLVAEEGAEFARSTLREAVCAPFDARWFEGTWRSDAPAVAARVLEDALLTLAPVLGLFDWALARADQADPREEELGLFRALAEHSALRGERAALRRVAAKLPTEERLSWGVVLAYLEGDLAGVQARLDESQAWKRRKSSAAPLFPLALSTLLALARGASVGGPLAKSLIRPAKVSASGFVEGWPSAPTASALGRALRRLLRAHLEPEGEPERLDAHQFPPQSAAWELLIAALTVHLHEKSTLTRAAWGKRLLEGVTRWSQAGYPWFARQALALARALDSGLSLEGVRGVPLPESNEPLLMTLLEKPAAWRKSLEALAAFTQRTERSGSAERRRVAWFVDMVRGELQKPALEEFVNGTGWTRGRRVPLDELCAHSETLPREDREVLRALVAAEDGDSASGRVLAALCGHPRVFNGARSRLPVEVVHATCRVETRSEHEQIVIALEPAHATTAGVHVVPQGEHKLLVYRVSEEFAELARVLPADLRIPQAHAEEALPILAELAERVEVHSPKLVAGRSRSADATPCLRVSSDAGAFWVELGVRPFGKTGRFFPVREGPSAVTGYRDGAWIEAVRDFDAEALNQEALLGALPTLANKRALEAAEDGTALGPSVTLSEEELFALLVELRESGTPCALEWKNSRPIGQRGTVSRTTLRGALRRKKGWYLVTGGVRLDAVTELGLAELVRMPFTKNGRFIRLPSGDFLEVEAHFRRVLTAIAANAASTGGPRKGTAHAGAPDSAELQVPDAAFGALGPLLEPESGFDVDASVHEWNRTLEAAFQEEYAVPEGLNATLRPYQLEGYRWLRRSSALRLGVILADDMGLGKTLQVIALLLTRASEGPALVVAPTSVCSNWIEEIERFAPSLRAREYTGKERRKLLEVLTESVDVLVVSYALLQQDTELLSAVPWNTAVLDEAQFIKNPGSLRAKAAFRLEARYRLAMTGTPVENHLGDLWSIFHFLNPALLGPRKQFELLYMQPIERDQSSEQRAVLKNLIFPFVLRRIKDQVLRELPRVTARAYEVRFSEDEALRYALLRKEINDKLHDSHVKRERKLEAFAEIMRLRRFCCHPRLVFPDAPLESSKLSALIELVEELRDNGHRALVFSQFVDFLELVREHFDERGIRYSYLDGATPKEQRQSRVRAFQAGETDLFLISLKAGGFGLNLTAADYVIHLDPWWNPAVEAQATDRAHRIGQRRPVTVYRLVTKDSIEQKILELHREKRALAEALLEGSDVAAQLSAEDLKALLS